MALCPTPLSGRPRPLRPLHRSFIDDGQRQMAICALRSTLSRAACGACACVHGSASGCPPPSPGCILDRYRPHAIRYRAQLTLPRPARPCCGTPALPRYLSVGVPPHTAPASHAALTPEASTLALHQHNATASSACPTSAGHERAALPSMTTASSALFVAAQLALRIFPSLGLGMPCQQPRHTSASDMVHCPRPRQQWSFEY